MRPLIAGRAQPSPAQSKPASQQAKQRHDLRASTKGTTGVSRTSLLHGWALIMPVTLEPSGTAGVGVIRPCSLHRLPRTTLVHYSSRRGRKYVLSTCSYRSVDPFEKILFEKVAYPQCHVAWLYPLF